LKHSQVIQTLEAILITVKTVLKEFLKISSTNVSRQSRTVGMWRKRCKYFEVNLLYSL